jgi:hypothetical protein
VRLRAAGLCAAAMLAASAVAPAQEHHHHDAGAPAASDPPITITLNPEARVSVARAGALPPPAKCGTPAELAIRIVNQGNFTLRLEASLADPPADATLHFAPAPLTGAPKEMRALHITLSTPGTHDLTITFKARHEAPDLGGRDRVHFLMRCFR